MVTLMKRDKRVMDEKIGIGRFGGSLKVDNVQMLAEQLGSEIPDRYIRPEMKEEIVAGLNDESSEENIPVIDFSRLFDFVHSDDEAAKLHSACEGWGFFQLVNHAIPEEVTSRVRRDIKEFFKLPLEEKEKVAQLSGQIEGFGQAFVHSKEQKLDWCDMLYLATFPPDLKQLKFWPTNPSSFRATIEEYMAEVKRVTDCLLKIMSQNLGLGIEKLYEMFKGGIQSVRINYYPPCPTPEKALGVAPHSDPVGLTILLQANELQGLQIKRYSRWLPVKPLYGAVIVNIGDVIEILSNGRYKSIEHRALVNSEGERISVATFHTQNVGELAGPIPELLSLREEKPLYKTLDFEEYAKLIFASKLERKSVLDHMKLNGLDKE